MGLRENILEQQRLLNEAQGGDSKRTDLQHSFDQEETIFDVLKSTVLRGKKDRY